MRSEVFVFTRTHELKKYYEITDRLLWIFLDGYEAKILTLTKFIEKNLSI